MLGWWSFNASAQSLEEAWCAQASTPEQSCTIIPAEVVPWTGEWRVAWNNTVYPNIYASSEAAVNAMIQAAENSPSLIQIGCNKLRIKSVEQRYGSSYMPLEDLFYPVASKGQGSEFYSRRNNITYILEPANQACGMQPRTVRVDTWQERKWRYSTLVPETGWAGYHRCPEGLKPVVGRFITYTGPDDVSQLYTVGGYPGSPGVSYGLWGCVGPKTPPIERFGVTISGKNEVRPTFTGGSSSTPLVVTVKVNGQPKSGVNVSLKVDVSPYSGGHHHHDSNRPKGSLSKTSGVTNDKGEIEVVFQAPAPSGIHQIVATCEKCEAPAQHEIAVKVPNLVPFPPPTASESSLYKFTSIDPLHEGQEAHKGQFWLTESGVNSLFTLIWYFSDFGWGTVALNDASLPWGGRYEIKEGDWEGRSQHAGHRLGEEIDISFLRAGNVVKPEKQALFYREFCEKRGIYMPFTLLHHYVKSPHFHVYLLGQKPCRKTEN